MDDRSRRIQQKFEWPMVIAALLVLPVLLIEESNLGQPWEAIGDVLNWASWLAFLTEAVVMIYVTPQPWTWIKRHPLDIAVILLSPPFIPDGVAAARLFRLLRALRLLRVFTLRRLLSLEGIQSAAFIAAFVVLVGGAAYAAIERTTPDGTQELTSWDGIWWAISTVTTVGYGDNFPTTDAGRAIGIAVMSVGIGFVALLTGFVANRVLTQTQESKEREDQVLERLEQLDERLTRIERHLGADDNGHR